MGVSLGVIFATSILSLLCVLVIFGFVCAAQIDNKAMRCDIKDMRRLLEKGDSKIKGDLHSLEKEAGIIHAEMYG